MEFTKVFFLTKFSGVNPNEMKTQADKIDGDVVINVRKGKLIYVYDLEVTLKWEGELLSPIS